MPSKGKILCKSLKQVYALYIHGLTKWMVWLEENEGRENGSEVREIPGGQKVKGIIRHFKDFPFKLSEMGVF